jgi:hypothetical protein
MVEYNNSGSQLEDLEKTLLALKAETEKEIARLELLEGKNGLVYYNDDARMQTDIALDTWMQRNEFIQQQETMKRNDAEAIRQYLVKWKSAKAVAKLKAFIESADIF